MFKLEHPANLVSKMFMLEYMRELTPEKLYEKANPLQKEKMFYKYSDDSEKEFIDINWEYCLFIALLPELENLLKKFLPEIELIENQRQLLYKDLAKQKEQKDKEVSINLMDIAKADIKNKKIES